MKKETREELIVALAKIRDSHANWVSADERRRCEFAKSFNWLKEPNSPYRTTDREVISPSWEQIFVEVGRLLAARNFMDYEGNISELECKLENLEEKIKKEIHPNL